MNDTPLFSICIASFNNEAFLPDLFASIASQTFSDWEVIFVDDCSQDGTRAYIESQTIIPREKITLLVNSENQGQFKSRRTAYENACGNYALSIDSDDTFTTSTALEIIAQAATAPAPPDVIMFNMTRDPNYVQPFINYPQLLGTDQKFPSETAVFNAFVSSCRLNNLASKAIRLPLLTNTGTENKPYKYYEDRFQSFFALCQARSFYLLDENLYYYRVNPNSVTKNALYPIECFTQLSEIESVIHREAKRRGCETALELARYIEQAGNALTELTRKRTFSQTIEAYRELSSNSFFRYALENCATDKLAPLPRLAAKFAYDKRFITAYLFAQSRKPLDFSLKHFPVSSK